MKEFFQNIIDFAKKSWEPANRPYTITAFLGLIWFYSWLDWSGFQRLPTWVQAIGFLLGVGIAIYWYRQLKDRGILVRRGLITAAILPVWALATFGASQVSYKLATFVGTLGMITTFFVGLCWFVWYVEMKSREYAAEASSGNTGAIAHGSALAGGPPIWNPFNLAAWYYHRRREKLDQSFGTFLLYLVTFVFVVILLTSFHGCEIYEMPEGGGKPKQKQMIQIQKIIKKKFVINPFSSVIFNPPPIDDVKLQLEKVTKHRYKVGYGEGNNAGFAGGTKRGMVRFIRLEYEGGDWDQDGLSPDLNMLTEYGIRTEQRVHTVPETRTIAQLANFPKKKSPPFVYMTGQKGISVSKKEIEILREYLLEKHGMLFADNGGSGSWDGQFKSMMSQVLPTIRPVRIPLDHMVHRQPYQIPFLPYVAPHGGKDAIGWVHQGRLVCYYHPGDIGDAWADGHAGVKRQIWEYCYQLGTNVIFYAHAEYAKWLEAEEKKEE